MLVPWRVSVFFLIFKPLNFPKVRLRQSQTSAGLLPGGTRKPIDDFHGPRPHADGRPGQRLCAQTPITSRLW